MKTKILCLGAFALLSLLVGCNSDEDNNNDSSAIISNEEVAKASKIDASIDDVSNIVEDQYGAQQNTGQKPDGNGKGFLPSCATFTTVLTNNTWTRTIDFGVEGCTLENGNKIKGKIIISFSNNFDAAEQSISYTFEGFFHNGKKLEGSKNIIRSKKATALLATAHPVLATTIDLTVTFEDGSIYKRTGTLNKEMTAGFDTWFNWEDNKFVVTGNGSTTFPNGDIFATEITTPLEFNALCKKPFAVKGIVSISKNGAIATLDYGNGDCDTLANITKDGVTTEIDLKD